MINAALQAVAILVGSRPELREELKAYRREQTAKVLAEKLEQLAGGVRCGIRRSAPGRRRG